jgi:hypothetical protein
MTNFQVLSWQFLTGTEGGRSVFMIICVQYDLNPGPYEHEEGSYPLSCTLHVCVCGVFQSIGNIIFLDLDCVNKLLQSYMNRYLNILRVGVKVS